MKTTMLLVSTFAALGFATPVQQAPQPPVSCTGNQKSNLLVSHDYNFPVSDTYEFCNGLCFNFPAAYNNSISAIDVNDHATQRCTLYDLPLCRAGGDGSINFGNERINDLRTRVPNIDKKASSILCTWTG